MKMRSIKPIYEVSAKEVKLKLKYITSEAESQSR